MTVPDTPRKTLPNRTPNAGPLPGAISARLATRASHSWDAFLARTWPLPGEDRDAEHTRADDEAKR